MHISRLDGSPDDVQCLLLRPDAARFGVFSLAFSNSGKQILAGGSDGSFYLYDRLLDRRILKVPVQSNAVDVNSVGFVDDSSDIFFSGTDNGFIKVITVQFSAVKRNF